MHLFYRSAVEADWRCQRERFWLTEAEGMGIVPAAPSFDLEFGLILDTSLNTIAEQWGKVNGFADIVEKQADKLRALCLHRLTIKDSWAAEEAVSLGEGLLRAYWGRVWPRLMQDYEVAYVQPEVIYKVSPSITFMTRPDLILRHRESKKHWYWEAKTTSYQDDKWINSWSRAIQLHSGIVAAEQTLGIEFDGAVIQGLYKGYRKDGRINSPFTYAWTRQAGGVGADQYNVSWLRGWERFAVWLYPDGGTQGWVQRLDETVLDDQFPRTPPIMLRRDLCDQFFAQRAQREQKIIDFRAGLATLDEVFQQNFSKCEPAFGFPCPYREACWHPWIGEEPLVGGTFKVREPHHQMEQEQHAQDTI